MRDDKLVLKELGQDMTDLLDQVENADNLEDLEVNLVDSLREKLWAISMEMGTR
jgi:hypothetical protein